MEKDQSATTTEIRMTPLALAKIRGAMAETDMPSDYCVRIGIRGGGCAGMSYLLGFDEKRENDQEFEYEGLRIVMDRRHGMYVLGMEIDYHESAGGSGFVFTNPAARED